METFAGDKTVADSISSSTKTFFMEENRNMDRRDENRDANDEQLRPNTMNEVIREASGNPDADLNQLGTESRMDQSDTDRISPANDDLTGIDSTRGVTYTPNDASAVRSGGTTDMDDQTAGGAGLADALKRGAGTNITTKRNVTGSDFDGQVKTS